MTTNQTIDGVLVSRKALEDICDRFEFGRHWSAAQAVQELRALLDAPAVERKPFGYWRVPKYLPLQGAFFPWIDGRSEQEVKDSLEHEFGFSVRLLYESPVPQPQPAPVAVALPDPGPDPQVEARAEEIYGGWSSNTGFTPWVDGGNSSMQEKARDIARRALASPPTK